MRRRGGHRESARTASTTVAVYLGVLLLLVAAVLWAGRSVLFQPWSARDWVSGALAGRTLFLVGGRDRAGASHPEVYRIDIQRARIRRAQPLPSARFGAAVAATPAGIVVLGGYDGVTVYADILLLDGEDGRHKLVGTLPGPNALGGAAASGSTVFLVGGWDGSRAVDEIVSIDTSSGRTRTAGRLPSPREQAGVAIQADRLYVIGGVDAAGNYLDEVVEMSLSGSVLRTARLRSPRARVAAVATADGIIVVGGWAGEDLDEAALIDPRGAELEVSELPRLPKGVSSAAAAELEGGIIVARGTNPDLDRQIDIWAWSPSDGKSRSITLRSPPGW